MTMPRLARARRAKQAASLDQLELPFPEIQLELQFGSEPPKRFNYFGHYLALLSNEYSKPTPNVNHRHLKE